MNSAIHRLRHPLRLLLAACLLLLLPLIGMAPRATALAAHEQHAMHSQHMDSSFDCATTCARATTVPPTQATCNDNEAHTPDPAPEDVVPYHVQFQYLYVPKAQRPNPAYSSSPSRPPDIVKMSARFRF